MGIDAQLSEMYQLEQDIGNGPSLGLINIKDGPIHWINLIREEGITVSHVPVSKYHMDYGVPLTNKSEITRESIFPVRLRRFPIFGPVVRIHWRSRGWGGKVADQLNGDPLMGQPTLMDASIELTYHPRNTCWLISARETRIRTANEWRIPSREQWDAYQVLAKHLVTAT